MARVEHAMYCYLFILVLSQSNALRAPTNLNITENGGVNLVQENENATQSSTETAIAVLGGETVADGISTVEGSALITLTKLIDEKFKTMEDKIVNMINEYQCKCCFFVIRRHKCIQVIINAQQY